MDLITVSVDTIRIGQPLPFSLRDESGVLLANKGYVIPNRADLELIRGQRGEFFVDVAESEEHQRAYRAKLDKMLRQETVLGDIAQAQLSVSDLARRQDSDSGTPDWLDLQSQAHVLLRDTRAASFQTRLGQIQRLVRRYTLDNPDGTLLTLLHLSGAELQMYAATHGLLVAVIALLAAHEVLKWPEEHQELLCRAALTMNLGMGELQDRLAQQSEGLTPAQRAIIDAHPERSVSMLRELGVTDAVWLEAVALHHSPQAGALAARPLGSRLGRLIQRADLFAAKLAPRSARGPDSAANAMQACYFDENREIDEAGAALIKAVGIHSPGSLVRLSTNEIGIVVRRGTNTTTPKVAVLVNREGLPAMETMVRDTSRREFRVVAAVPRRDVKVKVNLQRLLPLTRSA